MIGLTLSGSTWLSGELIATKKKSRRAGGSLQYIANLFSLGAGDFVGGSRICSRLIGRRLIRRAPMLQFFADARRLAGTVAQVIQLRATHVTTALDLDRCNGWRIKLKRALDAFPARYLAHDERRIKASIATSDNDAFVGLHTLARAFDTLTLTTRCRRRKGGYFAISAARVSSSCSNC